jgi:hypothetical protein
MFPVAIQGNWTCFSQKLRSAPPVHRLLDYGLLLLWCGFLFGYGIGAGTLYRTEALRAIIGREALHGAALTPTLYGEPFLTKPPGMYAAIAAASIPLGDVTTISARLPSVLAATATILLFFATFQRVVGRGPALAGAMLMPVSLLWLDKAPSAEIDMLQLMWVAAALLFFLRAVENEERKTPSTHWWVLALMCVAAGFLTKWTAPAFFYLTAVTLLIWRRQLTLLLSWRHLLAAAIGAGLCAGWAWAVAAQVGWSTLIDAIQAEGAQRFQPNHHGRAYPWLESLTYPFAVLIANLPWSLPALWTLRPSFFQRWDENGRRLLQLLHCWTWPNLIFWSLPAQHHVRYSLPMCPGIVGLGVMALLAWAGAQTRHGEGDNVENKERSKCFSLSPRLLVSLTAFKPRAVILGILIAWCAVKAVYVEAVVPKRTGERHVRETASRLAELVPAGEMLYLCKLKDEGLLFYYNRPARRFHWDAFPPRRPLHALLIEAEWRQTLDRELFDVLEWLRDQQGDPIALVRFR